MNLVDKCSRSIFFQQCIKYPKPHGLQALNCSLSSISIPPSIQKPQTPLFLKPPIYTAALSDLRRWKYWANTLVNSIGTKFQDTDNGPDSTLLQRELNWFIQDALDTPSKLLIDRNNDNHDENTKVKLRAEVEDLYVLWKQRIEERRPFQYIVGCEHWRDLVLNVQEGVLIPRPETELIIDLVGDAIEGNPELGHGLWADLGTGSGAIAIGIARLLGNTGRVIATDLSHVAVSVSSFNVMRYHLQDKVTVKVGSWFEPLVEDFKGKFDGLVSNPPYIPSEDLSGLQAEVGMHEPKLALDGGRDGMDDLLHLCDGAVSMLKPGGFFTFETNGENHTMFLKEYLENKHQSSFSDVKIVSDFVGIKRFVTGFRAR